jgi:hypothetical protein
MRLSNLYEQLFNTLVSLNSHMHGLVDAGISCKAREGFLLNRSAAFCWDVPYAIEHVD